MRLNRPAGLALIAGALGCGGSSPAHDAGSDGGACDEACVVGPWQVRTGACGTFCSLSPAPEECTAADCEQTDLYLMAAGHDYLYLSGVHSPSRRTLTLIVRSDSRAWQFAAACQLSLDPGTDPAGQPFTCSAATLELPTRVWNRIAPALADQLAGIETATLPVHLAY